MPDSYAYPRACFWQQYGKYMVFVKKKVRESAEILELETEIDLIIGENLLQMPVWYI